MFCPVKRFKPVSVQLRYLQTLTEIGVEKNTTVIFPVPVDFFSGIQKLLAKPVTLCLRRGGEKLQPDAARPRRHVKDMFQERSVPPWRRERLPYLWSGERQVWVAGLGIDCAFHAAAGRAGVTPRWVERDDGVRQAK